MKPKNPAAQLFEVRAQNWAPRFTVPKKVCRSLGVKCEDELYLTIWDARGHKLYEGKKTLKSDTEIYGKDIRAAVSKGQKLKVEARRKGK